MLTGCNRPKAEKQFSHGRTKRRENERSTFEHRVVTCHCETWTVVTLVVRWKCTGHRWLGQGCSVPGEKRVLQLRRFGQGVTTHPVMWHKPTKQISSWGLCNLLAVTVTDAIIELYLTCETERCKSMQKYQNDLYHRGWQFGAI